MIGPVLFTIYINTFDLPIQSLTDILSKFADDTKVGKVINSDSDLLAMQSIIDSVLKWSKDWQMDFNVMKCKVVHFGRNNQNHNYTMDGQSLEASKAEKDVGVIISNDLKPSLQCAAAAKKANMTLGRMARAVSYRDRNVWLRLYQVYVRPQLEYAVQAWSPWLAKDIKLLENVQRRAVRMTSGLKGKNYEEKLLELGMQSLESRRMRGDAIQTWKILSGYDDVDEKTWFSRCYEHAARETRQSSNDLSLQHRPFKHDYHKNSYSIRATRQWNELPISIRQSKTIREFKSSYDRVFVQ